MNRLDYSTQMAHRAADGPDGVGESPLEHDTQLMPSVIAEAVCREVQQYLVKRDWDYAPYVAKLVEKAERVYVANIHDKWGRDMRLRSNRGRDLLYTFMRHWLCGILKDERNPMYDKLPSTFANGEPLP